MAVYTKYPHKELHMRVRHLNNRDFAILFGVFLGMGVAIDGIFFQQFIVAPILGNVVNRSIYFKIGAVILSGGTFGNLLSYVGSCIDIITNYNTIFDLIAKIRGKD